MHTHMQTCVLYTHVNMLTYANTYAYIQIHIYIYTHTHTCTYILRNVH